MDAKKTGKKNNSTHSYPHAVCLTWVKKKPKYKLTTDAVSEAVVLG